MAQLPYGNGNWFHSRVSSSKGERASIVKLVKASFKYPRLRWSGSKTSLGNIKFAGEINVNPSQMQTKIRAFMRIGFIKEGTTCPLRWTKLGEIWQKLVINAGNNLAKITDEIEELIIASSLALYSFGSNGFSENSDPILNYRPIYDLLLHLDTEGFISQSDIEVLIGRRGASGSNYSYWVKDLENSAILEKTVGGFRLTQRFPKLLAAIKTVKMPANLSRDDWMRIQNDTLDIKNPYLDAILQEMEEITQNIFSVEGALPLVQKDIVTKMIDSTNLEEEEEIDKQNYRIEDEYGEVKIRRKQSAWSKKVREDYHYECCLPECDIKTSGFTEAAHIKKYSEKEEGNGHRANPRNGLCLCPLCHLLFDKGYFTLTPDLRIEVSEKIKKLTSQRLKDVVIKSAGKKIKLPQRFPPLEEFIQYHRTKEFMQ